MAPAFATAGRSRRYMPVKQGMVAARDATAAANDVGRGLGAARPPRLVAMGPGSLAGDEPHDPHP
jgi:hypothetical protein